jgi:tetratricopeptide (TPR) repeat protein
MRRAAIAILSLALSAPTAFAQPPAPPSPASTAPPLAAQPTGPSTGAAGMRAYHAALAARRLGSRETMSLDDVRARLADAEEQVHTGRLDEAIARLTELVEHPSFEPFAENDEGRAAVYLLGDALASAGAYAPARAYLGRLLTMKGAWDGQATYAHRAARRLVEIGLETERWQQAMGDLAPVPPTAREETRGEILYVTGRAREAEGDPDGAMAAYAQVTPSSRFWSQATYLRGLISVERGKWKEGEDLFCKVADPKRQDRSAPVFADERFFAVRDLARLALGRVAHEAGRFDDARYYYYLVPRDSDRLAEALYEAATTRYEKKDYQGARELLDELKALQIHHRYEDEAWILDSYIDLAQCKFPEADKKLVDFLARYEPVRDAARRVATDERLTEALLRAAQAGSDAASTDVGGVSPDAMRAIAALVRMDPEYGRAARRRAVAEHEASGLRLTMGVLADTQRSLATNGGVRPAVDDDENPAERAAEVRAALEGLKRQVAEAEAAHAAPDQIAAIRADLKKLEVRVAFASGQQAAIDTGTPGQGVDLPDLIRADQARASALYAQLDTVRRDLDTAEGNLARDAMHRLDLRLSRLLRRARLGRIESVLGRKRALEVEIEAINAGVLPADAVDSLDAARYLQDNEEYWPFEGDDWPDEFVGGDTK